MYGIEIVEYAKKEISNRLIGNFSQLCNQNVVMDEFLFYQIFLLDLTLTLGFVAVLFVKVQARDFCEPVIRSGLKIPELDHNSGFFSGIESLA